MSVLLMDQQVCRLCLLQIKELPLLLFENVESDFNIVQLISNYIGVEVLETDPFSKVLCRPCVTKFIDFHNFALLIKKNQEFLIKSYVPPIVENISCLENEDIKTDLKEESEEIEHEEKAHVNEVSHEEKVNIAEDLPEDERLEANYDTEAESDDNSLISNKNEDNSEDIPDLNPEVNLEETDESDTSEEIEKPTNTRKSTRQCMDFPETPNDVRIKKFYKYECALCKNHPEIRTFRAFKVHYKSKHGISAYINCCGKKFARPYTLVQHIREHLMPDSLICSTCGKKLRTKHTLLLHMDTHVPVEERPLKCKNCDMRFVRKHFLLQHEKIHMTDDQSKYICDLCGKRFPTDWRLKTHMNVTHTDEKPFFCEICAKSFKSKIQLTNHMYTHDSKDKVHKQCDRCGVWLRSPRSYYVHMKDKHDENAPKSFPCDKCTHISPTKKALYAHCINKHGPKKRSCIYCSEMFSSSNLLKSHMIKHTGPGEPLQCPFCPKSFSFRSGFYSHKKRVHSNMTENTKIKS